MVFQYSLPLKLYQLIYIRELDLQVHLKWLDFGFLIQKVDFLTTPNTMLRTQAIYVHAWMLPRVRSKTLHFTLFQIQYSRIIPEL
jgi:hypothetical protein